MTEVIDIEDFKKSLYEDRIKDLTAEVNKLWACVSILQAEILRIHTNKEIVIGPRTDSTGDRKDS